MKVHNAFSMSKQEAAALSHFLAHSEMHVMVEVYFLYADAQCMYDARIIVGLRLMRLLRRVMHDVLTCDL